jgi:hypothetical protein
MEIPQEVARVGQDAACGGHRAVGRRGRFRARRQRVRMRLDAAPRRGVGAVRGMVIRTLAAAAIAVVMVAVLMGAVLSAGPVLAPQQASARAGGFAAGQATFNHGDFHRFGGQPFVRFGQVPRLIVRGSPAGIDRSSGLEPVRHHRRVFGFGLPVTGIGVSFGPFDEPPADLGAIDRPPGLGAADDSPPEGGDRILVGRGGCRSETRIVASEDGGERPIRITWCRKG